MILYCTENMAKVLVQIVKATEDMPREELSEGFREGLAEIEAAVKGWPKDFPTEFPPRPQGSAGESQAPATSPQDDAGIPQNPVPPAAATPETPEIPPGTAVSG